MDKMEAGVGFAHRPSRVTRRASTREASPAADTEKAVSHPLPVVHNRQKERQLVTPCWLEAARTLELTMGCYVAHCKLMVCIWILPCVSAKMQKYIERITPKSFNRKVFAYLCVNLVAMLLLVVASVALKSSESRNFKCDVKETMASKKDFIEAECLNRYDQRYSPFLTVYLFISATFGCVVVVCIMYALSVGSRVKEIERICSFSPEDPQPSIVIRTRRVSSSYFLHLFGRFVVVVLASVLQYRVFFPRKFSTTFSCDWPLASKSLTAPVNSTSILSNYTFVMCNNLISSGMVDSTTAFAVVNIGLAVITFMEAIYLLFKLFRSRHTERDFLSDSEFCRFYLLGKQNTPASVRDYQETRLQEIGNETETVQPLIPPIADEDFTTRALDEVYVPLIIRTGRAAGQLDFGSKLKENRNTVDEYQKFPDEAIAIENLEDLFVANNDTDGKDPRTILVVGRPGIGKTLLCRKILHDWSKKVIGKEFEFAFLFQFRWFNSEENKKKSLIQLLKDRMCPSSGVLQYMLDNPEKILLIFDGLDELKTDACITMSYGNGCADQMPLSALFEKLVKGHLLKGATVLTTTRATGVGSFSALTFDRRAEIVGFSPEKVEDYVKRFWNKESTTSERMWNHINGYVDLLNLCYIPANCSIVCHVLEMFMKSGGSGSETFALPTTVTELYEYAIRIFLLKHHPECQKQQGNNIEDWIFCDKYLVGSVKETLDKLSRLAYKGIEENRVIFDWEEVEGMENCGLLHKIPMQNYKSQFYFLHLTMQEFLAAREVVDSKQESRFISSKARDETWYLVTQFVSGLLKAFPVRQKTFFDSYYETMLSSSFREKLRVVDLPVVMMKCFSEAGNDEIVNGIIDRLEDNFAFESRFELSYHFTPSDCTACFYFLEKIKPLLQLRVSCRLQITTCSELGRLLKCASPKRLRLPSSVGDDGLKAIFDPILENKPMLRQADIANPSSRRDQGNTQQHGVISSEPCNLATLLLFDTDITAIGVSYLCNILTSNYFEVSSLVISEKMIGDKGAVSLANALTHPNCKLTELDIVIKDISEAGACALANAITHPNCKLTKLDIRVNHISDLGAGALSNALTHPHCKLTELDIGDNDISDVGAGALANALTQPNCKLTELHISDNDLSHLGSDALANALTHPNCKLTKLGISENHISDVGTGTLANVLTHPNCKLTELDISRNDISDVGAGALANALTHPNCKLTKLYIKFNAISDVGAGVVANALTHPNCKLTKLYIKFNTISDVGAGALANALTHPNCKLTELDISGNDISDVGAGALANALTHPNCKLTELDINDNDISDLGAGALANALTHPNCKLTELHISDNDISDVGAGALATALTHPNCKLTELDITSSDISDVGAGALANALSHQNSKLTNLAISRGNISSELICQLRDAGKHKNCVIDI